MPRWENGLQVRADVQRIKREAVLKAAGRAFGQKGYHNTSLDDVAKDLRVSKGTLYNYVKDKQEILFELHKLSARIGEEVLMHAKARNGTGLEILREIMVSYITRLAEEAGSISALLEVDALRPADRAEAIKRRDTFERSYMAILKKGMKDGSIRSVDPKIAIFTFMGAINWMSRWFSPDGRLSGKEVAQIMCDLLLNGLALQTEVKTV